MHFVQTPPLDAAQGLLPALAPFYPAARTKPAFLPTDSSDLGTRCFGVILRSGILLLAPRGKWTNRFFSLMRKHLKSTENLAKGARRMPLRSNWWFLHISSPIDGKGTRFPLVTFESPAEGRHCLPKGKNPSSALHSSTDWNARSAGTNWLINYFSWSFSSSLAESLKLLNQLFCIWKDMIHFFFRWWLFWGDLKIFLEKNIFFLVKNNAWAWRKLEKGIKWQRKSLPPRDDHW